VRLEIDGGVKVDNIKAIAQAGADTFVAGSAIFGSKDYAQTIRDMHREIKAESADQAAGPVRSRSTAGRRRVGTRGRQG
jgi:ribulose-phosphate 3-epimerase